MVQDRLREGERHHPRQGPLDRLGDFLGGKGGEIERQGDRCRSGKQKPGVSRRDPVMCEQLPKGLACGQPIGLAITPIQLGRPPLEEVSLSRGTDLKNPNCRRVEIHHQEWFRPLITLKRHFEHGHVSQSLPGLTCMSHREEQGAPLVLVIARGTGRAVILGTPRSHSGEAEYVFSENPNSVPPSPSYGRSCA